MHRSLMLASALTAAVVMSAAPGCVQDSRRAGANQCESSAQCDGGVCHQGRCLDADGDEDSDTLSNRVEVELGTDPTSRDTDGDGADDAAEVGADPNAPLDTDGDDRIDAIESSIGDSDRDCVVDELDPDELGPPEGTVEIHCRIAGICGQQREALNVVCTAPRLDVPPSWECDYSQVAGYAEIDTTCDGADDDCDGEADEEYEPRPTFCDDEACTDTGITSCVAGVERDSCEAAITDSDPTCNGVDDDCDGATDDDYEPTTTTCGIGPCQAEGTVVCEDGRAVVLCTPKPAPKDDDKSCDGVDDDCDGETDEDFEGKPILCGVGACMAEGTTVCHQGEEQDRCVPLEGAEDDETCDGIDDDCDGTDDEDFETLETSCGQGECAASGLLSCDKGETKDSCKAGAGTDSDGDCNSRDDDCDGETDEDYQPRMTSCGTGACAGSGTTSCLDGTEVDSCEAGEPLSEDDATCDGADDDCDGETDEDYEPQPSTCGVGACAATGTTACVLGEVDEGCTPGEAAESDPTCDGEDDDCDGGTDEDFVSTPTDCGKGACATTGMQVCALGGDLVDSCVPLEPSTAVDDDCDGVDDNCDGQTDEDYPEEPISCGMGACTAEGVRTCEGGEVVEQCTPGSQAPSDVSCNQVDDDCDGQTDEDYVVTTTTCGTGECAAAGSKTCVAGLEIDSCVPLAPNCTNRECGSDGCGGSCGTCPSPTSSCLAASCNSSQQCETTVASGCYIDGACIGAGAQNPADLCEVCDPEHPEQWSLAAPNTPCEEDGNPCTDNVCDQGGNCGQNPFPPYSACDAGDDDTLGAVCLGTTCTAFGESVVPRFGDGGEAFLRSGSGTHRWGTNGLTVVWTEGDFELWVTRFGASEHGDPSSLALLGEHYSGDYRYVSNDNQLWEFVDGAWTAERVAGTLRDEFPAAESAVDYPSYYRFRYGLPLLTGFATVHAMGTTPGDLSATHRRCVSPVGGDGEPTTWTCVTMGDGEVPEEFGANVTYLGASLVMGANYGSLEAPSHIHILAYDSVQDDWSLQRDVTHAANGRRLIDFYEITAEWPQTPSWALGVGSDNLFFATDLEDWIDIDVGAGSTVDWQRIVPFEDRMFVLGRDIVDEESVTFLASAHRASANSESAWTVATFVGGGLRGAYDLSADSEFLYLMGWRALFGPPAQPAMWRLRPPADNPEILEQRFNGPSLPAGWAVTEFCHETTPASWRISEGYVLNTGNCVETFGAPAEDLSRRGSFVTGPDVFSSGTIQVAAAAHDNDDFGIVYGVQDDENYYRVSFNKQDRFAMLLKFVDNSETLLDKVEFDPEMHVWYRIEVKVEGTNHRVYIDNVKRLEANDGTFGTGTFGLYTNAMLDARFDDLRVFD